MLTSSKSDKNNSLVVKLRNFLVIVVTAATVFGCGAAYQAGTRIRAQRMAKALQVGESTAEVHRSWGEPDIRRETGDHTEVWSYAKRANSNDVVATLLYTSAKEGDNGTFLDLEFVDGKLKSWRDAEHTMPPKQGTSIGYSVGLPMGSPTHY